MILEAKNLSFRYEESGRKILDQFSLQVDSSERVGILAPSGFGKTTLCKILAGYEEPETGTVLMDGKSLYSYKGYCPVQMIWQHPEQAVNPRLRMRNVFEEGDQVETELIKKLGIEPDWMNRFPTELSGGELQRFCIARALALNPEFVVCDEPVSALDVSVQAQIINLLKELQEKRNLTYLFISHDLSVVEHISDTIGVMYLGGLVETGTTADIFANPLHPYTEALFSAIPMPDPDLKRNRIILEGNIPSPANPPKGCKFHTRCRKCMEICKNQVPEVKDMGNGHKVRCHLYD